MWKCHSLNILPWSSVAQTVCSIRITLSGSQRKLTSGNFCWAPCSAIAVKKLNHCSKRRWRHSLCRTLVFLCTSLRYFVFTCSNTGSLHLAQAQNVHATVELAARRGGVFNATEQARQEATEWSDKGSRLFWAVCGGLKASDSVDYIELVIQQ